MSKTPIKGSTVIVTDESRDRNWTEWDIDKDEYEYSQESFHKENSIIFQDELDEAQERNNEELILDNRELYGSHGYSGKRRIFSDLEEPLKSEDMRVLKSADDFLKNTSELKNLLLKKPENIEVKDPNQKMINNINEILVKNNFQPLEQTVNVQNLLRTLNEVLMGFDKKNIDENDGTEIIFKKFYGRNSSPKNPTDIKTFELILSYENKTRELNQHIQQLEENLRNVKSYDKYQDLEDEYNELKHDFHKLQQELSKSENLNENLSKKNDENSTIISEICKILTLKDSKHIVRAVVKLEKVLRAVPHLEKFIREVCIIVFPDLKEEKNKSICSQRMDDVIPKLKKVFSELDQLRRAKENHMRNKSPIDEARTNAQSTSRKMNPLEDISRNTPKSARREFTFEEQIVQHFCHLYEIPEEKPMILAKIDQIFIFVREIESFLKMSKAALRLEEDVSMNEVLHNLKAIIKTI
ncbi:unnamed protein product [Blepharisma stoltei]|uniref:Centrosomal protein of 70 kDa n=1 Tax=Blepharisma stoltei TaxID=1481888 RepID=A0AAU9JAB0_9CILI|nr:unnamed protein product [Blepharisma stoltei]